MIEGSEEEVMERVLGGGAAPLILQCVVIETSDQPSGGPTTQPLN